MEIDKKNMYSRKKNFLEDILRDFLHRINKSQEDLDGVQHMYKILLENEMKGIDSKKAECEQLLEILNKVYTIFCDEGFRQILRENNITVKQLVSRYEERILGDDKRRYDMSKMFDANLIASSDKQPTKKKVGYIPKDGVENRYRNAEGKTIIIQHIGDLRYSEFVQLQGEIEKYRIMRQISDNNYQVDEVFSNIQIINMGDPEYRQVVLEELLSENNIQLSKAGGYIGKIVKAQNVNSNMKAGEEATGGGAYFYKINEKYALEYDSTELSAVMLYEQSEKENANDPTTKENSHNAPEAPQGDGGSR